MKEIRLSLSISDPDNIEPEFISEQVYSLLEDLGYVVVEVGSITYDRTVNGTGLITKKADIRVDFGEEEEATGKMVRRDVFKNGHLISTDISIKAREW